MASPQDTQTPSPPHKQQPPQQPLEESHQAAPLAQVDPSPATTLVVPHVTAPEEVDNTPHLQQLCNSYSGYLQFPPETAKELNSTVGAIEPLLARLDELGTVVDTLGAEHIKMLQQHLPLLRSKAGQLTKVFAGIDILEGLLSAMSKSVSDMEAKVDAAESAASVISVQRIFSLFSSKRAEDTDALLHKPVHIVDPVKYLSDARKAAEATTTPTL